MFVPIFVLIVLILSVIINTGVEGATDDNVPLTARIVILRHYMVHLVQVHLY